MEAERKPAFKRNHAILTNTQTQFYTAVTGGVFLKLHVFKRLKNTLSE